MWPLLLLLLPVALANPGLQVALSADPLNEVLMTLYAEKVPSAHFFLGDFDQKLHTDMGDIDMKLSNFSISKIDFDFPTSAVAFQAPHFLIYRLQQLMVLGSAAYDIDLGLIHLTPGNLTLSLSNTNVTLNASLVNVDNHVQLELAGFELDVGTIYVKTQLPDELNDLVNHELAGQVSTFQTLFEGLITKELPTLNTLLMGLNETLYCPMYPFSLSIGVTEGPLVEDEFLVLGLNGTVMLEGMAVQAEAAVSVVPGTDLKDGIQAAITDFVVNSFLKGLWEVFSYNVTSLPASLGINLDTSSLAILIPQLRKTYGPNHPVYLNLYTSPGDHMDFWTDGELNLNCSTKVAFWVYSRSQWQLAVTLDVALSLEAGLALSSNLASISLDYIRIVQITQVTSAVGQVSTTLLQLMLNAMMKTIALSINPSLSALVLSKQPITLPYGLDTYLRTNDLVVETGYILVGADL
jgi:hypothetical protein